MYLYYNKYYYLVSMRRGFGEKFELLILRIFVWNNL